MTEHLITTVERGILTATLNRPAIHNAIDEAIVEALAAAMDRAESDPSVRALCLRANGATFCGGVDLGRVRVVAGLGRDQGIDDTVRLTGMMIRLSRLSKPTLALLQGPAYGAGIGLVVACDIVLAVPEVHFSLSQVRHGLLPGFIAPFLSHAIGARRAKRYLLTGERFNAAEALALGLVHEVVPAEVLEERGAAVVADLTRGGPNSLAGTKRIIDAYGPGSLDAAEVRALAEEVATHRRSAEAIEGTAAFREKRRPAWCAGSIPEA